MLCSNCGKREVEVFIKQVINHEVHNLNLCRTCAEEMGFVSQEAPSITISFSLAEGEAQIPQKGKRSNTKEQRERAYDEITCASCGLQYAQFREGGILGCPACYEAFRFPLGALLQKEQGAESHWGGSSEMFSDIVVAPDAGRLASEERARFGHEAALKRLRTELSEAVSCEEYERAAQLRDRIDKMTISEMQTGGERPK